LVSGRGGSTRALAREIREKDAGGHRAAFRGSAMNRSQLPAMKRDAVALLGNAGAVEDAPVLRQALADPEALVREHATWARDRIRGRGPVTPPSSAAAGGAVVGRGLRAGDADAGAESRAPGPR
jgi:epoxyqueuosine reductase